MKETGTTDFLETTGTYIKDVCVAITHRNKPFKERTYRIATPTIRDMNKMTIGHLVGTYMRIDDNTLHKGSATAAILQYSYEAKFGAALTKSMIKKAFKKFTTHPRYEGKYGNMMQILEHVFK